MRYEGEAGIVFTNEELLEIWATLQRNPTGDNTEIRARIKRYLENYTDLRVTLITDNQHG